MASSSFEFGGSVAVVTGGASGIGFALAQRLASDGCTVAIVDIHAGPARQAADVIPGAISVAADVGDPVAVAAMVDEVESRLGPIDVYCSNAGIAVGRALGENSDWEAHWRVHGLGHINAARYALPGMVDRHRGVFLITASAAGLLMMMQSAPYTVTKHASVAFAEWLAVTHGDTGVQFHCLCPQGVRTPMLEGDSASDAELEAAGGIIEPSQVAEAVVSAVRNNTFLVLPHPEVHGYETAKVADRDRWIAGMRRLYARVRG